MPVRNLRKRAAALARSDEKEPSEHGRGVVAGVASDITDRERADEALREREAWLRGQREALESAVNGAPLEASLGALAHTARESLGEDARAAFYIADAQGTALHHVVGMPASYAEAVDGFKIGPESLACGLATHTGQPVLTTDVMKDARWEPWRWLAERFTYRGCWSFPIHSSAGKFVGTLALYWRHPREPTQGDLDLASLLTHTAAVIISHQLESKARRRAEDALRLSEERFAKAFHSNPAAIALITVPGGRVLDVNTTWLTVFGFQREDAIGKTTLDLKIWPNPGCRQAVADEFARTGSIRGREELFCRKSGEQFPVLLSLDRIRLQEDDAAVVTFEDITERKRAESALRESEERFRAMVLASSDVVYRMNPDWTEMRHLVGRHFIADTDAPTATWLQKYIHPDDQPRVNAAIQEAIRTKGTFELEHRVIRVDGTLGWTFSRAVPMLDASGAIVEWFGTARDVTARKIAEQEREHAAALAQVDRVQRVLVAEVQHRSRNLLAVVRSIVAQTIRSASSRTEIEARVDDRLAALSRAHSLLSRAETPAITVRELVEMELGATAPGAADRVHVRGSAVTLPPRAVRTFALALHELATNAVKYGALGSNGGRLEVSWSVEGSRLVLTWAESSGTPRGPVNGERRGFGRELIEQALPYELDARTALEIGERGVRCTIDLPLGGGRG